MPYRETRSSQIWWWVELSSLTCLRVRSCKRVGQRINDAWSERVSTDPQAAKVGRCAEKRGDGRAAGVGAQVVVGERERRERWMRVQRVGKDEGASCTARNEGRSDRPGGP
eukprot:6175479-Pleurochrysis_carterae.AAC.3